MRSKSLVSDCVILVTSLSMTAYNEVHVSSAKSLMLLDKSSKISLVYNRNMKYPNTDPWGTPAFTTSGGDVKPSITTFCCLFVK